MKKISFLSGKGGVTKTTLARAVSVAFIKAQWVTGVFDLDLGQNSYRNWNERRKHFGHTPEIEVISGTVRDIERVEAEDRHHVLIVDGAAYGSRDTEAVAKISDMIVVSCRFSLDDMQSAVETMNNLVLKGIPPERFCVVFSGVPEQRTPMNYVNALEYFNQTPYFVSTGFIEQKNSFTDAQNEGLALNEVRYPSVRKKVEQVLDSIFDRFGELTQE